MRAFSLRRGRREKSSRKPASRSSGLGRYYRTLSFQTLEPRQLKAANILNTPLTWIAQNGTLAPLDQTAWQLAAPPAGASQNALASWQNLLSALSTAGAGGAVNDYTGSSNGYGGAANGYGGAVGGPGAVLYIEAGTTLQLNAPLADNTLIAGQGTVDLNGQSLDNTISLVGFDGTLTNSSTNAASVAGAIAGGSFTIAGDGNIDLGGTVVEACWTLAGNNTLTLSGADYAGAIDVESGTVQLSSPAALTSGAATINGGALDLAGQNATLDSLQGSGGAVVDSGSNANLTINNPNEAASYNGTISGNVGLTQAGNGYGGALSSSSGYGGSSSSSSGSGGSSSGYGGSSSSSGYGGSSSGYGGSNSGSGGTSSGYGGSSSGDGGSSSSSGYGGSSSGYGGSSSGYGGPQISGFSCEEGPTVYTFTGTVTDPTQNPAGMTITFGGVLAGQSTTVDSDGTFMYSTQIPDNTSGTVTAQTTDNSGHTSNVAMDDVSTVGSGNGYGGAAGSGSGSGGAGSGYGGSSGSDSGSTSSSSGYGGSAGSGSGSSSGYGGSASGSGSDSGGYSNGYGGSSGSSSGYGGSSSGYGGSSSGSGGVLDIQAGQTVQLHAPPADYTTIEGSGTLDLNGQSLDSTVSLVNFSGTLANSCTSTATIGGDVAGGNFTVLGSGNIAFSGSLTNTALTLAANADMERTAITLEISGTDSGGSIDIEAGTVQLQSTAALEGVAISGSSARARSISTGNRSTPRCRWRISRRAHQLGLEQRGLRRRRGRECHGVRQRQHRAQWPADGVVDPVGWQHADPRRPGRYHQRGVDDHLRHDPARGRLLRFGRRDLQWRRSFRPERL